MNKVPFANTFFYEFFIDERLCDHAREFFLNQELIEIDSDPSKTDIYDNMSTKALVASENKSIFHKELFEQLQLCLDKVSQSHFVNSELIISEAWLAKSSFGNFSQTHHHSFSIFSGLLYLTDNSKTDTIFFLNDNFYLKYERLFGPIMKKNNYEYKIKPKKGKLIIWDSDIDHKIATNKERNIRYTLAFNTWLNGKICEQPTQKLEVKVENGFTKI